MNAKRYEQLYRQMNPGSDPSTPPAAIPLWRAALNEQEQAAYALYMAHNPATGFLVGFLPENSAEFDRLRQKVLDKAREHAAGEAGHTPTPWFVANGNEIHDRKALRDEAGARTGETPNIIAATFALPFHASAANAAFIVRACNSHAALVAALESLARKAAEIAEYPHACSSNSQMAYRLRQLDAGLAVARAALNAAKS